MCVPDEGHPLALVEQGADRRQVDPEGAVFLTRMTTVQAATKMSVFLRQKSFLKQQFCFENISFESLPIN